MQHTLSHSTPEDLNTFVHSFKRHFGGVFSPRRDVFVARAPARLDVMGGIADYSGSVVLEGTLKEATIVAAQARTDKRLLIKSLGVESEGFETLVEYHLDGFFQGTRLKSFQALHNDLTRNNRQKWASYILGVFAVLYDSGHLDPDHRTGINIGISSTIPLGAGVSSSAALEVAALQAIRKALNIELDDGDVPMLCQKVENHIVGAPCGIMDQITSALGKADTLLAIRCQPDDILKEVAVPPNVRFVGINSAVKHAIDGSRYVETRTATFMGRKILFKHLQEKGEPVQPPYLSNVDARRWTKGLKRKVPARLKGKDFIQQYNTHDDTATEIIPTHTYPLRSRTEHPILENARVLQFIDYLEHMETDENALIEAGNLMYASHESYSKNCGLGAPETDLIVELVKKLGPAEGFYGAKITGGGSGGTVAVLVAAGQEYRIQQIASQYTDATGLVPDIFQGSTAGALNLRVVTFNFD